MTSAVRPIASLPMYDWPEIRPATDRFWTRFRNHLRAAGLPAPDALTRSSDPFGDWRDENLLVSQTCGRPYANWLADDVALAGVPTHAETGATPGRYFSVLVGRADQVPTGIGDLEHRRLAFNGQDSQSGFAAPLRMMMAAGARSTPAPLETGAHRASIRAVADGAADWAAIDAVTWELALRHETAAQRLSVFARTPETPALPLIAGKGFAERAGDIAAAFGAAVADLTAGDRDALLLTGIVPATPDDYRPLAAPLDITSTLPGLAV